MRTFNFENLNKNEIAYLLTTKNEEEVKALYEASYRMKLKHIGNIVHLRGIAEISNVCTKDCYYCGIRKSNPNVNRYTMTKEDVIKAAKFSLDHNYGSIAIQAGERDDPEWVDFVEEIITDIHALSDFKLGITLSLGEQTRETFARWRKAGATRYLLRIETSDPDLYKKLHPADHSFENRVENLKLLRETGYQVGTGVMIGLPYQTANDLADDILFMKEMDIDMIGMGPYIPHHDTPLATADYTFDEAKQLDLGHRMIALTRLVLKDVNIAATTALQALGGDGRLRGLQVGANIIMPIVIDDTNYRKNYFLYDNKPGVDENCESFRKKLEDSIISIGESISYGERGDSRHYKRRKGII
jgi:biotin synthase